MGNAPIWCPDCGAPRTWDRLDGSVAYYCKCPGYGAGWDREQAIANVRAALLPDDNATTTDAEIVAFFQARGRA